MHFVILWESVKGLWFGLKQGEVAMVLFQMSVTQRSENWTEIMHRLELFSEQLLFSQQIQEFICFKPHSSSA